MSRKQPVDKFCDSYDVIRKYIDLVESCGVKDRNIALHKI